MSAKKVNSVTNKEASVDLEKREFMGKVGKYAVVGAGMATLMDPTSSSAGCYIKDNPGNCKGVGCGTENSGKDGQLGQEIPCIDGVDC